MKRKSFFYMALISMFLIQLCCFDYVSAADFVDNPDVFTDDEMAMSLNEFESNDLFLSDSSPQVSESRVSNALYNVNNLILEYGTLSEIPANLLSSEDILLAANTWALFHTTSGKSIYVYDYCTVPGASSYYVRLLQTCLTTIGFDTNGIDGIYGPNTEYAIVQFQKSWNLAADGIAGENTWRRLSNFFCDYGIYIDF